MDEKTPNSKKWIIPAIRYAVVILLTAAITLYASGTSFEQIYLRFVIHRYFDGEVQEENIKEAELAGMVSALGDEHSYYIPKEIGYQLFNETVTGEYGGIGVEILSTEEGFLITDVFEQSPAQQAGMQEGDYIIQIEGENTAGMDFSLLTEKIRGEIGSTVNIGVKRGTEELQIAVKRAEIDTPTVSAEIIDNHIGYIVIDQFDMDTDQEIEQKINSLEGIDSLIIDLRDNPGGILQTCLRTLDLFLDEGTMVIARYKGSEEVYEAEKGAKYTMPMTVLVNGESASCSEIFAACMQDNQRATLVGTTTYGKGSIQRTFTLPENAAANITVGHFCSPNGNQIDKVGVTPDLEVAMEQEAEGAEDVQLAAAIETLKNK